MEVPKSLPGISPALQQRLRTLLRIESQDDAAFVTRFPSWKIGFLPDPVQPASVRLRAVGEGEPERVRFDERMLEAALAWLAADENAWLAAARRNIQARSSTRLVSDPSGPDPEEIASALRKLFASAGDLGLLPAAGEHGPSAYIELDTLILHLEGFRRGLLFALALHSVAAPDEFWEWLEREIGVLDHRAFAALSAHFGNPADARAVLARVWFVMMVNSLGLGKVVGMDGPGEPVRIDPGPRTPEQEIWFTIALSIGAIVPPYPLPGVYQCAYHRCRRIFTSNKTGVSGKLRFCCPEHGKRFYAARRMKEKAARARNASQTPEE